MVTSENLPVLSAQNEPIEIEEGEEFANLIGVVRTNFNNLEKWEITIILLLIKMKRKI